MRCAFSRQLVLPPFMVLAAICMAAGLSGIGRHLPAQTPAKSPTIPTADEQADENVDFERQIFPILADRCFACHGEEEQEGQLRLDARAIVLRGGTSGPAVVPGKVVGSSLYQRIVEGGEQQRMPLDDDPLTDAQIQLIRRWIEQGANWPEGVGSSARQVTRHWAYQPPQRPEPPAVLDSQWPVNPVDAFVLARMRRDGFSPSPPEHRARLLRRVSLDLVGLPPSVAEVEAFQRDADPDAYEKVVDRLLASPRYGERWARPWLDMARYADSNGYQADQYRDVWPYRDWVIDALNRDLPFDRFTVEQIAGDLLPDPTLAQRIATGFHRLTTCNVEAGVDPEENRVEQVIDRVNTTATVWLGTTLECAQCHNHKYDPFSQRDYYRLFAYFNNTPLEVEGDGVTYNFTGPKMPLPLSAQERLRQRELKDHVADAEEQLRTVSAAAEGEQADWEQSLQEADEAEEIRRIAQIPADQRTAPQAKQLREFFLQQQPEVVEARKRLAAARKELAGIEPDTTLVMVEMEQGRQSSVFARGDFLSPTEPVRPGTPAVLHPLDDSLPANRLGLARWLADPANPLTARVAVNRWWAALFGEGLVATLEDFGAQGEPPTHPELLDWLATDFMERGWSMKHVHKTIVMSATYRQSSRVSEELLRRDPSNRLLARGPRFRMSAEMIRDHALAASGRLQEKMGGPPVFPPQPDGIWRHVGRNAPKYATSRGTDRFRRGIYTIWRRSAPYASFVNFDAPDRASCVVQRPRTNTPLQALTLLNDPAYFELAQALAARVVEDLPEGSVRERLGYAFRRCVARAATDRELAHLTEVYRRETARLEADAEAARALIGERPAVEGVSDGQLAAWVYVANVLLNLDETITKG